MATFKELREQLGLSREQMAVRLRVTAATIANWESGRSQPQGYASDFLLYCDGYECDLSTLSAAALATRAKKND